MIRATEASIKTQEAKNEPEAYPQRERFFSHRFTRLLTKVCVAQDLGAAGAWLLAVIAHQEDAAHYRRAVTFWDEQLAPLIGAKSPKTLRAVRDSAVKLGWLHYEPGSKGRVARYWVLIPPYAEGLDDAPTDDGHDQVGCEVKTTEQRESNGLETECEVNSTSNRTLIGLASDAKGFCKGHASYPVPDPVPEEECKPKTATPSSTNPNSEKKPKRFVKPTLAEVTAYCLERKNDVVPSKFVDFYESKGWMIGKTTMKDWKAAVRTWEGREQVHATNTTNGRPTVAEYDFGKKGAK
jgi:hypothetical protein